MSRYIDADALINDLEYCSYETWSKGVNRAWWAQAVKVKDNIKQCIERQPTAEVVEVVRCKDCKYHHREKGNWCEFHDFEFDTNDYCSHGEKKFIINY